ncbi:MAG: tyrosine-type recombinase/integrase [Deltaproteobacteria bacterium]|nr:tyrosine-type recombinase/integrase [Deltaproteobacteria bacterium]
MEERDAVFWDRELSGFGVRVYPSGAKVYVVQTRANGKSRRFTIGRHGLVSAEQARRKAAVVIASIKAGEEPGRNGAASTTATGPSLAEVAERYMREHVAVRCKPATARGYRHALDKVLLPAFGSVPLGRIGRDQVAALHYRLHKTPSMANRGVETLSRLFYMAEAWGVAPEGGNPCRFVKKYPDRSCERFLSEQEFRRLGSVLSELEAEGKVSASAVAAFRLLMLTGCRRNEILTLRWEDVDLDAGELRLRDAKTGARSVALSPAARKVLATLPRSLDNPWVIAGPRLGKRLSSLNGRWLVVRARAGLEDVRIHDLRHSFASRALALGESLTMIGKLLGHRKVQTTARYAHLARESVKTSAARVADSIAADMAKLSTESGGGGRWRPLSVGTITR